MTESGGVDAPVRPWRDLAPKERSIVAFTLIFLITLPMLTKIFTSDFGTHIAIGREIVRTLSVADKEFLNYPSLGMPQSNPVWLFQAVLYLVHSAGGEYAVSFLVWALTAGICLLIHRATVIRGANPLLAFLAILAFSGFLRIRIQPRPEIFTYFFISLTIYLLTEYYFGRRRRLIYLFPPLMVVWANSHPSYLIAFLLCGAFFLDALIRSAWRKEFSPDLLKGWVVPPLVTVAAGLLLCGLNPAGYEMILAPIHAIARGGGGASGPDPVMMSISELTPVKGTGFFIYYKAAALFVLVSLLLGIPGRRIYLLDLFLFAISFKGAWDSARAVSMMGLFLSPGISLHMTGFLERVREWSRERERRMAAPLEKRSGKGKGAGKRARQGREKEIAPPPGARPAAVSRQGPRHAVAAAMVLACLAFGVTTLSFSFSQLEYGIGVTEHKFSFGAAEFLRKNPVKGNMFNFFDIGGFLDWQLYPAALTFLDGRTYNSKVFMEHQQVTGAMPGWEEILRRYGVTYIVTKAMDSSGMVLPLVPALSSDPKWSLVYADGLFLVFVRNTPENAEYIRRHEVPKMVLPQHIIREAYHYMYLGISPIVAYQTMSNMYEMLGDRQAAIGSLRKALEFVDDPFLRSRLMRLEQGVGGASRPPGHP